ncbi:MAG: hypothetical protein BWY19_00496 [bacterium ADurb.Bin212]|nr:MAG: hypothetical protein BWY19_00496 [bacterium ADurb.Bin212]
MVIRIRETRWSQTKKMQKLSLKFVSIRFVYIIIGIAMGLLIIAQFRTVPDRITNPETPKLSLRETRNILYDEQIKLNDEIKRLSQENQQLNDEIKSKNFINVEMSELEWQRKLAGLSDVSGRGVEITLNDSDSGPVSEDTIVHASDLRDVVNYLWAGGAEAISINDQRIVATTAIDCVVNTILINNVKLSNPFKITAIGNSEKMMALLSSSLSLSDLKKRVKANGVLFTVKSRDSLKIKSYVGSFTVISGQKQ